jgi:hypothetical protein
MEPAWNNHVLVVKVTGCRFHKVIFYLIIWSYGRNHDKTIISFCDMNGSFVMDVSCLFCHGIFHKAKILNTIG